MVTAELAWVAGAGQSGGVLEAAAGPALGDEPLAGRRHCVSGLSRVARPRSMPVAAARAGSSPVSAANSRSAGASSTRATPRGRDASVRESKGARDGQGAPQLAERARGVLEQRVLAEARASAGAVRSRHHPLSAVAFPGSSQLRRVAARVHVVDGSVDRGAASVLGIARRTHLAVTLVRKGRADSQSCDRSRSCS
jgi:hypothetical protein